MHTATFKIPCKYPSIILEAVNFGDKLNVEYESDNEHIILHFKSDTVRNLVKATYSICNKIQLSIDTIENFNDRI